MRYEIDFNALEYLVKTAETRESTLREFSRVLNSFGVFFEEDPEYLEIKSEGSEFSMDIVSDEADDDGFSAYISFAETGEKWYDLVALHNGEDLRRILSGGLEESRKCAALQKKYFEQLTGQEVAR